MSISEPAAWSQRQGRPERVRLGCGRAAVCDPTDATPTPAQQRRERKREGLAELAGQSLRAKSWREVPVPTCPSLLGGLGAPVGLLGPSSYLLGNEGADEKGSQGA